MFVVFAAFPWIMADRGAIPLIQHYIELGKTWKWMELMIEFGRVDAALAFLTALILLPLAFWWAFRNRPVISGLTTIVSGLLLIYMFKVTDSTGILFDLIAEWSRDLAGFGEPYNIAIGTYGMLFFGCLLLFTYFYSEMRSQRTRLS
jgi:hypothetical protein